MRIPDHPTLILRMLLALPYTEAKPGGKLGRSGPSGITRCSVWDIPVITASHDLARVVDPVGRDIMPARRVNRAVAALIQVAQKTPPSKAGLHDPQRASRNLHGPGEASDGAVFRHNFSWGDWW